VGRPDLAEDTDDARIADGLRAVFVSEDAQTWEDRLSAANVPAAKLRSLAEALDHPQMQTSRAWLPLEVPQLGMTVRAPSLPFDAPWVPGHLEPAPTLGQHTADIVANSLEKVTS
jgi:crotonobetainyl-CoA:carnitine CoA-transferase CaiB-like acyl-CoA transferase